MTDKPSQLHKYFPKESVDEIFRGVDDFEYAKLDDLVYLGQGKWHDKDLLRQQIVKILPVSFPSLGMLQSMLWNEEVEAATVARYHILFVFILVT